MEHNPTLAERLAALFDHLGLKQAHVATQIPRNVAGFAAAHPHRIAGLLFHEPVSIDPAPFTALAERLVILSGDGGLSSVVAASASAHLPQARRLTLEGYAEPGWADHVRDRTAEVLAAIDALSGPADALDLQPANGSHAGISYDISGKGPALVLFPLFLAPTQWSAALPALTERFTVIRLGGAHLGGVGLLENRASVPSYRGMVSMMLNIMAPGAGESVLDVGAGPGALARLAASRPGAGPVQACDLNPYFVAEARALADQAGLGANLTFSQADAEHLPFPDASFDHAYSVTVLEECDADRALRELYRVVRPGGRVGVIVRAIDFKHYWNADLPAALREKVDVVPPMVAPHGVADASLYRRMREAGFAALTPFPLAVSFNDPAGEFMSFIVGRVEPRLDAQELAAFRGALAAAHAAGTLFVTFPHHCVVGVKPAG